MERNIDVSPSSFDSLLSLVCSAPLPIGSYLCAVSDTDLVGDDSGTAVLSSLSAPEAAVARTRIAVRYPQHVRRDISCGIACGIPRLPGHHRNDSRLSDGLGLGAGRR